jgi:hypothetical protein
LSYCEYYYCHIFTTGTQSFKLRGGQSLSIPQSVPSILFLYLSYFYLVPSPSPVPFQFLSDENNDHKYQPRHILCYLNVFINFIESVISGSHGDEYEGQSCGIYCCVVISMSTDVSEVRAASIIIL